MPKCPRMIRPYLLSSSVVSLNAMILRTPFKCRAGLLFKNYPSFVSCFEWDCHSYPIPYAIWCFETKWWGTIDKSPFFSGGKCTPLLVRLLWMTWWHFCTKYLASFLSRRHLCASAHWRRSEMGMFLKYVNAPMKRDAATRDANWSVCSSCRTACLTFACSFGFRHIHHVHRSCRVLFCTTNICPGWLWNESCWKLHSIKPHS